MVMRDEVALVRESRVRKEEYVGYVPGLGIV